MGEKNKCILCIYVCVFVSSTIGFNNSSPEFLIPEISIQLKNYHNEVDGIGDVLNQHSPAVAFGLL